MYSHTSEFDSWSLVTPRKVPLPITYILNPSIQDIGFSKFSIIIQWLNLTYESDAQSSISEHTTCLYHIAIVPHIPLKYLPIHATQFMIDTLPY